MRKPTELFVLAYPRAFVASLVVVYGLMELWDQLFARYLLSGGAHRLSTSALDFWFIHDRYVRAFLVVYVGAIFVGRLVFLAILSRRYSALEPSTGSQTGLGLRATVFLWCVALLVLPLYWEGKEAPEDAAGLPLFFGLCLLLEGLAPLLLKNRSAGREEAALQLPRVVEAWVLSTSGLYSAGILCSVLANALAWPEAWRVAPALLTRTFSSTYELDHWTLLNVVVYFLLRVAAAKLLVERDHQPPAHTGAAPSPVVRDRG